uniref:Reverse transcriptase domain-containing protein n=1 Tax=Halamphora calidilacuna TaxID=2133758 RepID=A0A2R4A3Q1_9STRA|nr:hypothetical protein [Halamphora calidilacuna]
MEDRAKQMLMKFAFEPEWEARFEINSYGFRPGYSVADAKWSVARQLQGGLKYFLDADIDKCFDSIDHEYLLNKLETISMFNAQIRSWLKAGISNPRIKSLRGLFIKQNYSCPHCGLLDEIIELHHVLDNNLNRMEEICFVHGHCHDEIHSTDKFN